MDVKEQVIMEIMNSVTSNMPDVDYRLLDDIIRVKLARYDVTLREEGLVVYTAQMTNEDIFQKYMVCKKIAGLSERTLDYYRYTLTAWLRFLNKPLSDTTPDDIRMYFAYLQTYTGNSPKTINNHRRNLSAFYQWLNDEEICKSNPVRRVPQMKEQYVPKKAFSNRELEKIRCAAAEYDELRASAIVEVFLSTGCRVGEMEKMQRHEVNWTDGSMVVHGKGNKDRVVFLNDKARFFLERYLKSRDDDNPNLFVSLHSPHDGLGKSSIEKIIREIGTECGVKAHPHKFRRTCATNALRHGMPIDQVARMLGHNSIETTKIYLDTDDEDLKYAHKRYVLG